MSLILTSTTGRPSTWQMRVTTHFIIGLTTEPGIRWGELLVGGNGNYFNCSIARSC